jgi:hypothetical protein
MRGKAIGGWLRLHPDLCAPNTKGLIMPTQTGEYLPLIMRGEVTEVVNLNPVTTLHAAKKLVRDRMERLKRGLGAVSLALEPRKKIRRPGSSRYRGVTWHKDGGKWLAKVTYQRKTHYIGLFPPTPEGERDAARAYDLKVLELVGTRAKLNFPEEARSANAS